MHTTVDFNVGSLFENYSVAIGLTQNSACPFFASIYNRIINNTTGITANQGAVATNTGNNQYSGNTTNTNATAASFGYIG